MSETEFRTHQEIAAQYGTVPEYGKKLLWQISDVYGATQGIPFETRAWIYDKVLNQISALSDREKMYDALRNEYLPMLERVLSQVRESLLIIDRKSQQKGMVI
jgi:hypothetical protein